MNNQIGFMQGRLCDKVDGKIQAFPWLDWQAEFPVADRLGLRLMEWTLDQERLYENPLMTAEGQVQIRHLSKIHKLSIPSLTADCFMQAPFWKAKADYCEVLKDDFVAVINASITVGIRMVVVPLVDNGSIENLEQENKLVDFLLSNQLYFEKHKLKILFESDYVPIELARFINRLPVNQFGINYDIGNSAALGFDPVEEFLAFGDRIQNVHVKDRILHGTTVPLGTGSADFSKVFSLLASQNYSGNYIMQTARAADNNHADVISHYKTMIQRWIFENNNAA